MSKKKKGYSKQIIGLVMMLVLTAGVLFSYQATQKSEHVAKQLTTPVAMDPIDSSNCIACHTSERIIGDVVMEVDEGHGSEGA